MQNPTDAMIAAKIGELELTKIRMAWALEVQQGEMRKMAALLVAKDAELERLTEAAKAPALPLDNLPANAYANGGTDAKPH